MDDKQPVPDAKEIAALKRKANAARKKVDKDTLAYFDAHADLEIAKLRGEYTYYANRNWKAIKHFSKEAVILLAFLAVVQLGIGLAVLNLNSANGGRIKDNSDRIKEIKGNRVGGIKLACDEANERHKIVDSDMRILIARSPNQPTFKTKAEKKIYDENINLFIDAIAPKYDCAARIAKFQKATAPKLPAPKPTKAAKSKK